MFWIRIIACGRFRDDSQASNRHQAVLAERDGGAGAAAERAVDGQHRAVGLGQRARQGQAEPQAGVGGAQALRQPYGLVGGMVGLLHAGSRIDHRDAQRSIEVMRDRHLHPVAAARELDGVGQQVEQHLPQANCIGDDARQVRRHLRRQRQPGLLGERLRHQQATLDDAGGLDVGEGELRCAGRLAVGLQHAVQHAHRMPGALVNIARVALVAVRGHRAEMLVLEDLGVGDYGTQRSPQLVRELGSKLHVERRPGRVVLGRDRSLRRLSALFHLEHTHQAKRGLATGAVISQAARMLRPGTQSVSVTQCWRSSAGSLRKCCTAGMAQSSGSGWRGSPASMPSRAQPAALAFRTAACSRSISRAATSQWPILVKEAECGALGGLLHSRCR